MRLMESQMTLREWKKGLKMKNNPHLEATRKLFSMNKPLEIKIEEKLETETKAEILKALLPRSQNMKSWEAKKRSSKIVVDCILNIAKR
jgi:hypothetical protein